MSAIVATKRTNTTAGNGRVDLQVYNDKIYYVWVNSQYIWKAEMNINGTGFVATEIGPNTGTLYLKFQVYGDKIYYVWAQNDSSYYTQLWTAEANIDGTGFTATQRTTNLTDIAYIDFQVYNGKIYYVFGNGDENFRQQIWTAEMNINGTGFTATQRTTGRHRGYTQLQIMGNKIYYVGSESDDSYVSQIWVGEMYIDGTGFVIETKTAGDKHKAWPQLQIVGDKIYYVFHGLDINDEYQIWTAEMNINGTGFTATQRTTGNYSKIFPQLQVAENKIYYVWCQYDDYRYQIATGEMNTDSTGFAETYITTSEYYKDEPKLQVLNDKIYYVWTERDSSAYQVWTGTQEIELPPSSSKILIKINGEWKQATPYVKVNGAWKEAIPFIKVNGQWKQAVI
ncbi:hypothetical protein [Petroclostridium sp. X23]|uniref:hypothetical protein n=1 Tax=Petroclostridium sp. X23 TaxID=3045146 RepID=UPI0024AE6AF4|nr:hypothetical protein [Petroclostridium sp. X23]WHH58491.1 hypothetical protein QKW49_22260 [Petroclostridium sp. X23]